MIAIHARTRARTCMNGRRGVLDMPCVVCWAVDGVVGTGLPAGDSLEMLT